MDVRNRKTRDQVLDPCVIYQIGFHLLDGSVWDRQTEFSLGDGQGEPELAPCRETGLLFRHHQHRT
jgi:hypothetical protein